jgi:hypothetical protein
MVAVYNFEPTPQIVQVYLGVVDTPGIVDAQSGVIISQQDEFHPIAAGIRLPLLHRASAPVKTLGASYSKFNYREEDSFQRSIPPSVAY